MNKLTDRKVHSDKKRPDARLYNNVLSFLSGLGRSKRLWVLGTLEENQAQGKGQNPLICDDRELLRIANRPGILFSLALTFLNLGLESILGQAKAFLEKLWYPLAHREYYRQ